VTGTALDLGDVETLALVRFGGLLPACVVQRLFIPCGLDTAPLASQWRTDCQRRLGADKADGISK
jgi:hypothetical protein